MKQLRIIILLLAVTSLAALAGVALAQQAGWIVPLAQEYSRVYKAAYDEAEEEGVVSAGREVVAEQVLYAYIATRSPSSGGGNVSPQPGGGSGGGGSTPQPGGGSGGVTGQTTTPEPSPTPTPTPTPTPEPSTITASDVDGYRSEYRVQIFVSSIGTNLAMSRVNTYTSNGSYVKLRSDGTLTTGSGGTTLTDRYSWACNPVNGSSRESRSYATDSHTVSLPKTDLSSTPLLGSSDGRWLLRICNGQESAPSSTYDKSWGESNSF